MSCQIIRLVYEIDRDKDSDKNILPSKQAAEAHLALMQLHQLRDCYRQGWTPSFFAPEIYEQFQQKQNVLKQLHYYHSFETIRTILKAFPNFIFDYWSAGVLFYEMLFGKRPFKVSSLEHYAEEINEDKTYEMEWALITEKPTENYAEYILRPPGGAA